MTHLKKLKEKYDIKNFSLTNVQIPETTFNDETVVLPDETLRERKEKLLNKMKEKGLDLVIIYADKEHGSNFEYFTGFIPRFEEALLAIELSGSAKLFLGNENLRLARFSRIKAEAVHIPHFSLPNQPMANEKSFKELMREAIDFTNKKIGVAGWKVFTSSHDNNEQFYDVPYFIVETLKELAQEYSASIVNCANILNGEKEGIRTINNADEIRYYEFGSSLASDCVLDAMNHIELGKTETELGTYLSRFGQPHSVVSIFASGERFKNAVIYPRKKKIELGDAFSITTAFKGGLSSRAGYMVKETKELPADVRDYLERVAIPYYAAIVCWLENVKIGMTGGEMYKMIETVLPKEKYGWSLNPGHLVSDEEWMSSPIYPNSDTVLQSGMIFQVDIIPSVPNYAGASAETGIALANAELREEIAKKFPDLWARIEKRRKYIEEELNIKLHPEVLPLSNTVGYYRPYALNKEKALKFNPNHS